MKLSDVITFLLCLAVEIWAVCYALGILP